MLKSTLAAALLAFALCACVTTSSEPNIAAGSKYVAMGSSFAAGPGVTTSADSPPTRCTRSSDNYAHQIARRHGLALTDVSCGGATTAHLLGPWNELPPQIEAIDADTRLVTITIGGNDIGYIGGLLRAACPQGSCTQLPPPAETDYAQLEQNLESLITEIRHRAPSARIIFVDYLTMLPPSGVCAATILSETQADQSREVARRLGEITARAARRGGAETLAASRLSADHSACGADPWATGSLPAEDIPGFHPNHAGMTAIAEALDQLIWPAR